MRMTLSAVSKHFRGPGGRKWIGVCLSALAVVLLSVLSTTGPWANGLAFEREASASSLTANFALWTTSSPFLTSLAEASSSPPASFVAPSLGFNQLGLSMSGPTQGYQTTGMQSLSTFSAPFTATILVTATEGTANPFEVFLANAGLTQFLTVTANVSTTYDGMWATATNISQLWQLGEQFEPPITPAFNTLYRIIIAVDTQGAATVTVENSSGTVLGTVSSLQPGTGPFYLVLGQRIGNAPTGPQGASWKSVTVN